MPLKDRVAPLRERPVLTALLAGLVATLAVPPFGWWPLAMLGLAGLAFTLDGRTTRQRAVAGLVFGLGMYVPALWWMTAFSLPGGIIVAAIQAGWTAVGMALVHPRRVWLTFPAGVVAADALRSLWPVGGLPLAGLDLAQAAGPLAPLVIWGGRLLLIGATAALGVALLAGLHRRWKPALLVTLGVLATAWAARALPDGTHRVAAPPLRVALVQGGGPRGYRASLDRAAATYQAHIAATRRASTSVDLIVWPEDVVDVEGSLAGSSLDRELRALARARGVPLVAGIVEDVEDDRFRNASVVYGPLGDIVDRFDKARLVPYGEYFPFRKTIEKWGLAELPGRDAIAGRGPGVLRIPNLGVFAVAISYEGFFDDRTRGGVRAGAEIILIPTNASSYKTAQVPSQQLAAARLRARETGRWVAQAAPTGFSAFIDHRGRLLAHSDLGVRGVLERAVPRRRGLTPYARWNDLPALFLTLGLLAGGWRAEIARRAYRKIPVASSSAARSGS